MKLKLNMICVKLDQILKQTIKNVNFGLWGFLKVFKSKKNYIFFQDIFQP